MLIPIISLVFRVFKIDFYTEDAYIFGSVIYLLFFVFMLSLSVIKDKDRKMLSKWRSVDFILILMIIVCSYFFYISYSIKKMQMNTIVNFSDQVCFDFGYRCEVVEDKRIFFRCGDSRNGALSYGTGKINKKYKPFKFNKYFKSVYSIENNVTIIQHKLTSSKYIQIELFDNDRKMGPFAYRNCDGFKNRYSKVIFINLAN